MPFKLIVIFCYKQSVYKKMSYAIKTNLWFYNESKHGKGFYLSKILENADLDNIHFN